MTWTPILDGRDATVAREIVEATTAALDQREAVTFDLARGAPGWALLFAYRAVAWADDAAGDRAIALLDAATEALAEIPATEGLHGGFTGIAWAVEHVLGAGEENAVDVNAEVDAELVRRLAPERWNGHFDLIFGLAGVAVYALERRPTAVVDRCLSAIVDRLLERAEPGPTGLCWRTPPEWIGELEHFAPRGCHNVGVAHGIGGVLAVLGRLAARGHSVERIHAAFDGAVVWLASLERDDRPCRLPAWVAIDGGPAPARLAWCYGDLGLSAALLVAARAIRHPAIEALALRLARVAASVPVEDADVDGISLCHGAFGNGHLFNRLFQGTGEEVFREASLRWFHRGLAMRTPGRGVGGFPDHPGLVDGFTGIALALLAAITPVEPRWDRVLCMDVPPRDDR